MSSKRVHYHFQIIAIKDHNPTVRELVLKLAPEYNKHEAHFSFRAGQFVMLHIPQQDAKPALRAYSIASLESDSSHLRLLFKYVENGTASKYVWGLTGHEILEITGPFGRIFFQEPPKKTIFLISTSSGLAPHLSYLETFAPKYPEVTFEVLIGVRTEKDIFCEELLTQLKIKYLNIKFNFVLSRASEHWHGKKGHVQDHLSTLLKTQNESTVYLCGNKNMTHDVRHKLIENNFDPSSIFVENF